MLKFVAFLALAFAGFVGLCSLVGCGPLPLAGVPMCDATVQPCAASQTRRGTQCALCDDFNVSLACQTADYKLATCVASCAACDAEPEQRRSTDGVALEQYGVHVCGFDANGDQKRYRMSSWCATCFNGDASLTTELCDKDGFCPPVVCVRSCDTCAVAP